MKSIVLSILCLSFATAGGAGQMDKKNADFVAANLIAVYYHELGHALIDILKLPIYGQEEDAADVLSAVLIHEFFAEETAVRIAYATAFGFLGETSIRNASKQEVEYSDVHGPDLQRYYTFVCLFYGANPTQRSAVARDLELPEERIGSCAREFELAGNSWGPVIDKLSERGAGRTIRFLADYRTGDHGKLAIDVIETEVASMNETMSLPKRLLVRVESCATVNAFYDAKTREIIMCTELAEWLSDVSPG